MATATKISLQISLEPQYYTGKWTSDSAKKTTELLQENHEIHHIFFNDEGFHNHIVHHLLSLYAMGADPDTIKHMYNINKSYQRPAEPTERKIIESLHDSGVFKSHLNDESKYPDYLIFFQRQIDEKGWPTVLQEHLFSGTEQADDFLVRTFSGMTLYIFFYYIELKFARGFLHPLIHIGFGIEFEQPAIIAEGLAQAAAHDNWIKPIYLESETNAKQHGNPDKTLLSLLRDIHADQELIASPHFEDPNKIRDGILKRAPQNMINIASQYSVREDQLEEKTAEMINFCGSLTSSLPTKFRRY
jgi:hypothetical protein